MVKGQWYTSNLWDDNDKVALKFSHFTKGSNYTYVYFTEFIRISNKKPEKYNGNWCNPGDLYPCPFDILQKYGIVKPIEIY